MLSPQQDNERTGTAVQQLLVLAYLLLVHLVDTVHQAEGVLDLLLLLHGQPLRHNHSRPCGQISERHHLGHRCVRAGVCGRACVLGGPLTSVLLGVTFNRKACSTFFFFLSSPTTYTTSVAVLARCGLAFSVEDPRSRILLRCECCQPTQSLLDFKSPCTLVGSLSRKR